MNGGIIVRDLIVRDLETVSEFTLSIRRLAGIGYRYNQQTQGAALRTAMAVRLLNFIHHV
jgi:hypothetical protein